MDDVEHMVTEEVETAEVLHADDSGEETNKGRPSRGRKRKYEYSDADRKKEE